MGALVGHRARGCQVLFVEAGCYSERMRESQMTPTGISLGRRRAITAGLLLGMSLGALEAMLIRCGFKLPAGQGVQAAIKAFDKQAM